MNDIHNKFSPITVSFCTENTPYEQEIQYLQASCEVFGIEYSFDTVPSGGSWEINCAFKPIYLLKKMEEKKRPLLWVDADAVFVRPPRELPEFTSDLAVRVRPECDNEHPSKIASGTVFVNATEEARRLLTRWASECLRLLQDKNRTKEIWDQDVLRKILFEESAGNWVSLPTEYCMIAGHPDDEKHCKEPVIVHKQASRKYKRLINCPEEPYFVL